MTSSSSSSSHGNHHQHHLANDNNNNNGNNINNNANATSPTTTTTPSQYLESCLRKYQEYRCLRKRHQGCLPGTFASNHNGSRRQVLSSSSASPASAAARRLGGVAASIHDKQQHQQQQQQQNISSSDNDATTTTSTTTTTTKSLLRLQRDNRNQLETQKQRQYNKERLREIRGESHHHHNHNNMTSAAAAASPQLNQSTMSSSSSPIYNVQIRLLDGSLHRASFPANAKLEMICRRVIQIVSSNQQDATLPLPEKYRAGITLTTAYPRKTFSKEQLQTMTLQDAKLDNNATLTVTSLLGGWKMETTPLHEQAQELLALGKLRGDTSHQKHEFKMKMMQEEHEQKMKDKKASKKALNAVRRKIKQDKLERLKRMKQQGSTREEQKEPTSTTSKRTSSSTLSSRGANTNQSCVIQVRMPSGQTVRLNDLKASNSLASIVQQLRQQVPEFQEDTFSLLIPFPRREFQQADFKATTIASAGLAPRGSLVVNVPQENPHMSAAPQESDEDSSDDEDMMDEEEY